MRNHCARLIGGCAPTVPNPNSVSWFFCQAKIVDISPSIVNSRNSSANCQNRTWTRTICPGPSPPYALWKPITCQPLCVSYQFLYSHFFIPSDRTPNTIGFPYFFFIWILSIFGATQYWSHSLYVFFWQLFAKLISASCLVLLRRWQGDTYYLSQMWKTWLSFPRGKGSKTRALQREVFVTTAQPNFSYFLSFFGNPCILSQPPTGEVRNRNLHK